MARNRALRGNLIEFVIIFLGVALAFGVENLRENLNERRMGDDYLVGIRQDLEGRHADPSIFFEAYWNALFIRSVTPNRNTMDEVLNSGNLRLIRQPEIRTGLLELYATYGRIFEIEDHVARDIDHYLYDPTFTQVLFRFPGPWEATAETLADVDLLTSSVTVENGLRLIEINLEFGGEGLIYMIEDAIDQVEMLLQSIPEG
jgi:hypothetical protein